MEKTKVTDLAEVLSSLLETYSPEEIIREVVNLRANEVFVPYVVSSKDVEEALEEDEDVSIPEVLKISGNCIGQSKFEIIREAISMRDISHIVDSKGRFLQYINISLQNKKTTMKFHGDVKKAMIFRTGYARQFVANRKFDLKVVKASKLWRGATIIGKKRVDSFYWIL